MSTRPATFTQPRPQPVLSRTMPRPPVPVRGNGPSPAVSTVPRPPQPAAAAVCNFGNLRNISYFGGCLWGKKTFVRAPVLRKLCQTICQ